MVRAMGIFKGRKADFLWPPSFIDQNEKDQFGLRRAWSHLGESSEDRNARVLATQALVKEVVASVIHQVGRQEACRLFSEALKEPPQGRRPDKDENDWLLAAFDKEIADGTQRRHAAMEAAKKMETPSDDLESVARRIRTLVKARNDKRARDEELLQMRDGPSLLGLAMRKQETDE